MKRLTDDSVMRQIANVVCLPVGAKEYKKLVSAGGAIVKHGEEGQARSGTNTPKLNEVTIALNPIYAYPKQPKRFWIFLLLMCWVGSLKKSAKVSRKPKKWI